MEGKIKLEWDKFAPLTQEQNELIVNLSQVINDRPIPTKFLTDSMNNNSKLKEDKLLNEKIENMQQFYTWFEQIGEESLEEEKYKSRIEVLQIYRDYCQHILNEVGFAVESLDQLENKYNLVKKKTGELHEACELLVQEQKELVLFSESLGKKLQYFNEITSLTQKLNSPSINVYEEELSNILKRLDECIEFMAKNKDFRDSATFLLKYKQLQNRGLILIKNEILSILKSTSLKILAQIKEGTKVDPLNTETLYYIQFQSIVPKLRPLCMELEKRAHVKECTLLLHDCHQCYFQQRQILLNGQVNDHVSQLCKQASDICAMTRSGCLYLINVCHNEFQLFQRFFATPSESLTNLLEVFSTSLYDAFRPIYIRSHNIENLCQLVYLLRTEILDEKLGQKGQSVEAFKPIVKRMLQDVQERLTYLTFLYIRDEIKTFIPSQTDLDYPRRLTAPIQNLPPNEHSLLPFKSKYQWYPTLERTLTALSRLYLAVDSNVFEGLAADAVESCVSSLVSASEAISKKNPLDGKLFLIRHLSILREQIAPFDANFLIIEQTSLDFSHLKQVFRNLLNDPKSLFAFSRSNPLLLAVPQLEMFQVDSKKELEKRLKLSMESFIMSATKATLEELLSFLAKSNAFLKVKGIRSEISNIQDALCSQSFASPEKVNELLNSIGKSINEKLNPFMDAMRNYITNLTTRNIFYQNIRDQITQSLLEFQQILDREYSSEKKSKIELDKLQTIIEDLDNILTDSFEKEIKELNLKPKSSNSINDNSKNELEANNDNLHESPKENNDDNNINQEKKMNNDSITQVNYNGNYLDPSMSSIPVPIPEEYMTASIRLNHQDNFSSPQQT